MQLITAFVQEDSVNTDADTPVPWWSYAKPVLAGAALSLVAAGRLQLDAPVRGKPFTLRQLLQHRAGLRCYGGLRAYHDAVAAGDAPWPVEDMLRRVDADTLAYEPGHGWGYSNVGYLLVRTLIEEASGAALSPALERLVFEPLGISGVTVAREPTDLDATAWGNARRYHPEWVYTTGFWLAQRVRPCCSYTACSTAVSCKPTCWQRCKLPTGSAMQSRAVRGGRRAMVLG